MPIHTDTPLLPFFYHDNGKPHESAGRKATGFSQNDIRTICSFLILFGNWWL
jgi:hypothetical protein